jgi:hypothetical protein
MIIANTCPRARLIADAGSALCWHMTSPQQSVASVRSGWLSGKRGPDPEVRDHPAHAGRSPRGSDRDTRRPLRTGANGRSKFHRAIENAIGRDRRRTQSCARPPCWSSTSMRTPQSLRTSYPDGCTEVLTPPHIEHPLTPGWVPARARLRTCSLLTCTAAPNQTLERPFRRSEQWATGVGDAPRARRRQIGRPLPLLLGEVAPGEATSGSAY